jgi:hypothetical protein
MNKFVKFLGITVDRTLSWKQHSDTIIPILNKSCYIIRRCKLYLSHAALKVVYYAFFHSVMSYGLITVHFYIEFTSRFLKQI